MRTRRGIGGILGVAAVAVALAAGVAATDEQPGGRTAVNAGGPQSTVPDWYPGLMARSEALNRKYRLGTYAPDPPDAKAPDWLTALMARSEALNRQYGLGGYAGPSR